MQIPVKIYEETNHIPNRNYYDSRMVQYVTEGRKWYKITTWVGGRRVRNIQPADGTGSQTL